MLTSFVNKHFLAIDLAASNGVAILGTFENGKLLIREVKRFHNMIVEVCGHSYWNLLSLYTEILSAIKQLRREGIELASIGIDTWGVDFALFGNDGELLRAPYSYRDRVITEGAPERFFEHLSQEELYTITGTQVLPFNTLFQLHSLHKQDCSALRAAGKILFLPDALNYMLTGVAATEYTIASTSNFLNPRTKQLDATLLAHCGIGVEQFAPLVMPGTIVGTLTRQAQRMTDMGAIPVVAVAGHDTTSAIAAVPSFDKNYAFLFSGTWGLMGIKVDEPIINEHSQRENFTNESGLEGSTRFLKNICGMWLLERCIGEWDEADMAQVLAEAKSAEPFRSIIDPDDACFANPDSMIDAITEYCHRTSQPVPETRGEFTRLIFESLALRYREVMEQLKRLAPFGICKLHIVGVAAEIDMLNQFVANSLGMLVVAGPENATALGNLLVQLEAHGLIHGQAERTAVIARSAGTTIFSPQDSEIWDKAYLQFLAIRKAAANQ